MITLEKDKIIFQVATGLQAYPFIRNGYKIVTAKEKKPESKPKPQIQKG